MLQTAVVEGGQFQSLGKVVNYHLVGLFVHLGPKRAVSEVQVTL